MHWTMNMSLRPLNKKRCINRRHNFAKDRIFQILATKAQLLLFFAFILTVPRSTLADRFDDRGESDNNSDSDDKEPVGYAWERSQLQGSNILRFSTGLALLGSNDSYFAVPIEFSFATLFGQSRFFGLGFTSMTFLGSEKLLGNESIGGQTGSISRYEFLIDAIFFWVPGRLYLKPEFGFSLSSARDSNVSTKLSPTFALGIGARFPIRPHLSFGIEPSIMHTAMGTKSLVIPMLGSKKGIDQEGVIPQMNAFLVKAYIQWEP